MSSLGTTVSLQTNTKYNSNTQTQQMQWWWFVVPIGVILLCFFNLIHKITKKDQESGLNIDKKQLIKIRKEKFFILQTSSSVTKSRKNLIQRIKNSLNKKVRKIKNYFIDYLLLIKFKVG